MTDIKLNMLAGQKGIITITSVDGFDGEVLLTGAAKVKGSVQAFDPDEADERRLIIPPMPQGVWPYAVLCNGSTVFKGCIYVADSPLIEDGVCSSWAVEVSRDTGILSASVTLSEGPQGPQGNSAYETWLSLGNTGSEQDFVDSLVLLPEENNISTGSGTENINWRWVAIAGGLPDETYRIRSIRVPSRTSNAAGLSSQPLFLTVWMSDGNGQFSCVATSSNSITPQVAVDSVWEFDSAAQLIPGRWLRLCPTTDPSETWQGSHSIGGRIVKVSDGSNIVGSNGKSYGGRLEMTITYETMREKYAPSSHVADAVAHLSEDEHIALAELLAHKTELLALLTESTDGANASA